MNKNWVFHKKWAWMCLLLVGLLQSYAISQTKETTVYVTKSGKKYHAVQCGYLKYSSIKIELVKAKELGYTPCSVCKPGNGAKKATETNAPPPSTVKSTPTQKPPASTSRQCSALTKAGARCKRTTTDASGKCWQHQ